MKKLIVSLFIGFLFFSCEEPSEKTQTLESTRDTTVVTQSNKSDTAVIVQSNKSDTTQIDTEEDCIFDLKTQNADFIKDIPEFSDYSWNDTTKEATINLANGETLIAHRGGCNHFGISGKWTQNNDKKHVLKDVEFWLEQAKWISKKIMDESDYQELEKMIQNNNYDIRYENNKLYIEFTGHDYFDWWLTVELDIEEGQEKAIIDTGYYFG